MAGLVAFLLALVGLAAIAPELGTLDFSIGAGEATSVDTYAVPAEPRAAPAEPAAWTSDPLAPPVELLAAR